MNKLSIYVCHDGRKGAISRYYIEPNGALTASSTSTVAVNKHPQMMMINQQFQKGYVVNYAKKGFISQFSVASDGYLTPDSLRIMQTGAYPTKIIMHSKGKYVYVINHGPLQTQLEQVSTISQFVVSENGMLGIQPIMSVDAGVGASSMAFDPGGHFVYVLNYNDSSVSQYSIKNDGTLLLLNTQTLYPKLFPKSIVIHPEDNYIYIVHSNGISQYHITENGCISECDDCMETSTKFYYCAKIANDGNFLYVASIDNMIEQYEIGNGGRLKKLSPDSIMTGAFPVSMAMTPNGEFLYVASYKEKKLYSYSVSTNGPLFPIDQYRVSTSGALFPTDQAMRHENGSPGYICIY